MNSIQGYRAGGGYTAAAVRRGGPAVRAVGHDGLTGGDAACCDPFRARALG